MSRHGYFGHSTNSLKHKKQNQSKKTSGKKIGGDQNLRDYFKNHNWNPLPSSLTAYFWGRGIKALEKL
jgi:hypothetical protein